jgi:hypothetical protein
MAAVLAFFDTRLGRYLLLAAVAIAAAVAFGSWQRSIGYREAVDEYHAQETKRERAWLHIAAVRQGALLELRKAYDELNAQRDRELKAKDAERLQQINDLKKRIPTYVSPASTRSCPDVPRGYLLFRADAAARANSAGAPAGPESTAELEDTPSGVSLSTLAETDAGQADAYRACADRDAAWLKYEADVEAWAEKVRQILRSTSPPPGD